MVNSVIKIFEGKFLITGYDGISHVVGFGTNPLIAAYETKFSMHVSAANPAVTEIERKCFDCKTWLKSFGCKIWVYSSDIMI